jgi:Uma2 family endonuclease
MALEYNQGMPVTGMTLEEFLEWELQQEDKHEFVDGEIRAFAGAKNRHNWLATQLLVVIGRHVLPCHASGSDTRIKMKNSARYPDVVVTCDERDGIDEATVRYPKLIVEVLSAATEAVDRTEKLAEYTAIATLEEYLLIDSRKHWAQLFRRSTEGFTMMPVVRIGKLHLASIDLTLDLDKIYRDAAIAETLSGGED